MDKIFFAGQGLYEVLFHLAEDRDKFLTSPTVLLNQQVVHVFPWQPVRLIKEELLTNCPVWVEFIDLPSFLWGHIKEVAGGLGKVLFSPSINSPNRNKVCILWRTDEKFPQTLEMQLGAEMRIVIYLKWGNLAGSCFHCGNLGHFSKNCPTLTEAQVLIPSYPSSKNLVPAEQIFGQVRPPTAPSPPPPKNPHLIPKQPFVSAVPSKPQPVSRPHSASTSSKPQDRGKRPMDQEGFTPVSYRRALTRPRPTFAFGYTNVNVYELLNKDIDLEDDKVDLEVVMNDQEETVPHTPNLI